MREAYGTSHNSGFSTGGGQINSIDTKKMMKT
jgi:hypothetical protein